MSVDTAWPGLILIGIGILLSIICFTADRDNRLGKKGGEKECGEARR